jgi:hypothetical protein
MSLGSCTTLRHFGRDSKLREEVAQALDDDNKMLTRSLVFSADSATKMSCFRSAQGGQQPDCYAIITPISLNIFPKYGYRSADQEDRHSGYRTETSNDPSRPD